MVLKQKAFFNIFPQSQPTHWLAGRSTPILSIVVIEGRLCTEVEGGNMVLQPFDFTLAYVSG